MRTGAVAKPSASSRLSASRRSPLITKPVAVAIGREGAHPGLRVAGDPGVGVRGRLLCDRRAVAADHQRVARLLAIVAAVANQQFDGAGRSLAWSQKPRSEPEDRAHVDAFRRARRAPRPLVAPSGQLAEDRHQVQGPFGELIVDARRDLPVSLPGEHAVGDHPVQPGTELFSRDSRQDALELDKPPRAGREVADDQQRPLVADEIECACIRRPLVVRMAFGRGYVRDWVPPRLDGSYLPSLSLTEGFRRTSLLTPDLSSFRKFYPRRSLRTRSGRADPSR